ncbi:hypothetical protein [Streptomyces sp. SID12488]|uniref:hypothetical protein n=1 Tax=Streptomyces sp. SID12488 TaxID=2706040 RepID=UPI0013DC33C8|nr:hypothetical protein [Streptomyces sp. SID12488]NEA66139.1 hypothetical protein [Streptomyces sp. SID12488]
MPTDSRTPTTWAGPEVVHGTLYRRLLALRRATDVESIVSTHDGAAYGVHELSVEW